MCRLRKLYAAAGERMRKIFGGARRKFESSHQILKKGLQLGAKCGILNKQFLGMAQIGSALPWGGRGRGFKSRYSDQSSRCTLVHRLLSFCPSPAEQFFLVKHNGCQGLIHFPLTLTLCCIFYEIQKWENPLCRDRQPAP